MAFDIVYYPPPRMGFRRSSHWNNNEWPHLASLYASTHNLDEDGKHPDPMMGQDNIFDPSEPYGAYRYYVQPSTRSEFSIEEPIYAHRSIYKDEESRSSDYASGDSFRRGTTCRVLLCVFLVLSFIGVVIAAITLAVLLSRTTTPLRSKPGPVEEFESTAKIFARDFHENLHDNSSEEFKLLEKEFCTAIEQMFKDDDSPVKNAFSGCEVLEFINGSVQVRYRIKLASPSPDGLKMEEHIEKKLQEHFKKKASQLGPWQNLKFDPRFLEKFLRIEIATTTTVPSTKFTTTFKTTVAPSTFKTTTFLDTDITSTSKMSPSKPYITTTAVVNATADKTDFHTERPQEVQVENITMASTSSIPESSTEEPISLFTTPESTVALPLETEQTTESTVADVSTQAERNYTHFITNVTQQAERTSPTPKVSTKLPTTPEDLATTATEKSTVVTDAATTAKTNTTVDSVTKPLPLSIKTTTVIHITERISNVTDKVTEPEMTSREPEVTTETISVTEQNVTDQVPVNETIVKDVIFSTDEEAKRMPSDYVVDYYDYTTEREHIPTTDVVTEMPISSTESSAVPEQTTQIDVEILANVTKVIDELNVTSSPDHGKQTHATDVIVTDMVNVTTSMPIEITTAFKTYTTTETQPSDIITSPVTPKTTFQPKMVLTTEVIAASEATDMQDNLTTAHPKLFTAEPKEIIAESFVNITDKPAATTVAPEVSTKYSVTTDVRKDSNITEETSTHVHDVSTAVAESTGIELTTASLVAVEITTEAILVTSSKLSLKTTAASQLDMTTTTNDTTEPFITETTTKSEESLITDSFIISEPLITRAPWPTTSDESPITNRSATIEPLITIANETATHLSLVNITSFTTEADVSSQAHTLVTTSITKDTVTVQEEMTPTSQKPMAIETSSDISVMTSSSTGNKSEIVDMHTSPVTFISTHAPSPGTTEYTLVHEMTTTQVPPKSFTTQTKLTTQTPADKATTADDSVIDETVLNPLDYYYYEETTTRKDGEITSTTSSATTNQTVPTTESYTSQPFTGIISTVQDKTDITLALDTRTVVITSTAKPVITTSTDQTTTSSADISSLIDDTTTVLPVKEITTTNRLNVTEIAKEASTSTVDDSNVIILTEILTTAKVANVTRTPTPKRTTPSAAEQLNDTGVLSTTSKNISIDLLAPTTQEFDINTTETQTTASVTKQQRTTESISTIVVTKPTPTTEISPDTVTVTATASELLTSSNDTDNQSSQISTTTQRYFNETFETTDNTTEVPAILTTSVENATENTTQTRVTESLSLIDVTQPTTVTNVTLDTVVETTKVTDLTTTKFDIDNQSTVISSTQRFSNETFEITYNTTDEPNIQTTSTTPVENATEHLITVSENMTDFMKKFNDTMTSTATEMPKPVNVSDRYNETTTAVLETVKLSTFATETEGNFTASNRSLHVTTSKTAEAAFIDEYSDSAFLEEFTPKNKTKLEETSVLASANDSKTSKPTTSSPFATIELHFRLANVTLETPNEELNATEVLMEMHSTENPLLNESSTTNEVIHTGTTAVNATSSPISSLNATEAFISLNESNLAPENTSAAVDALVTIVETREITENMIQNKSLDLTLISGNITGSSVGLEKNDSLIEIVDAVTVGTEGLLNGTGLSHLSQSIPGTSDAPALKETSTISTQTLARTNSLNISATEDTNIRTEHVTNDNANISEATITTTPSTVGTIHDNSNVSDTSKAEQIKPTTSISRFNETTEALQTTSDSVSNISETTQSSPTSMTAADMLNINETNEAPQTTTTFTGISNVNETDVISNLNETTESPQSATQLTGISNVNEITEAIVMTTTAADMLGIDETTQITQTTTTVADIFKENQTKDASHIETNIVGISNITETTEAPITRLYSLNGSVLIETSTGLQTIMEPLNETSSNELKTAATENVHDPNILFNASVNKTSTEFINITTTNASADSVLLTSFNFKNGSKTTGIQEEITTNAPADISIGRMVTDAVEVSTKSASNETTFSNASINVEGTMISPDDVTQPQKGSTGSTTVSPDDVTQPQNGTTGSTTVSPDDVTQPQNGTTGSTTVSPDDVTQPQNGSTTVSPDDVTQPQNGSTTVSPDDVTQSKNGGESSTDYNTSNLTDYYYEYYEAVTTESPLANKTVTKTTKSIIQHSTVQSPRANTTEHIVGSK